MKRQIRLNAFQMNSIGHTWPGLWSHPRDTSVDYNSIAFWVDLARLAERGKFDAIFLADTATVQDVYQGSPAAALAAGAQAPINDPALIVPLMASVTQHLGFGVTASTTYEAPYLLARKFSTLDHLTGGRVAWNIVTSHLESGARALGLDGVSEHDLRYERADEFIRLVYRLWEESWDEDAVLADRTAGIYADPAKVRAIRHEGRFFRCDGVHICEPSAQRTPVLYQAGSSSAGKRFAARHAECVFLNGHSKEIVARNVADLRKRAMALGRHPGEPLVFLGASIIVAPSEAEARDLYEEYESHIDAEGIFAQFSARTGVDLSTFDPQSTLPYRKNDAMHSAMESVTRSDGERVWNIADLATFGKVPTRGAFLVGTPGNVADELVSWIDQADIDGFNVTRLVHPENLEAIVDLLVPELQERGVYKTDYDQAPTLREKLFGRRRLDSAHTGLQARTT